MSKSRLLLLLNHRENKRLLIDALTPKFEIILPAADQPQPMAIAENDFDLVIFDLVQLGIWRPELSLWRQAAEPLFLPMLVLISQNTIGTLPPDISYQVDEFITVPVDPAELDIRLAALLRTRQLSAELNRQNQQLEAMNTLKSRFVSVVSHEFRTPLSVVSGLMQVLEIRGDRLTTEKKQVLFDRVKTMINKLTDLLDDLLVLNRNASSQVTFQPISVDLKAHCQQLLNDLELGTAKARKIDFQALGDLPHVCVDTGLVDTILNNLLSNALKYSPIDHPIRLSLRHQENQVIFEVEDQGQGIPLADQPALFEPFFRARNTGKISGTGLGLNIVKQCVDLHDGTIAVRSQPGQGTIFIVTLLSNPNTDL